jgi:hypothetical protein
MILISYIFFIVLFIIMLVVSLLNPIFYLKMTPIKNVILFNFNSILTIFCSITDNLNMIRYGLVARIPGFHPGGSGSIPGTGIFFLLCL